MPKAERPKSNIVFGEKSHEEKFQILNKDSVKNRLFDILKLEKELEDLKQEEKTLKDVSYFPGTFDKIAENLKQQLILSTKIDTTKSVLQSLIEFEILEEIENEFISQLNLDKNSIIFSLDTDCEYERS